MTNANVITTSYTTDDVEVIFRDNEKEGLKKIVKRTVTDIVQDGFPVDSKGNNLPVTSAKIHDDNGIIFIGNMDTVGIHYVDGTSQSLPGFLEEYDGSGIYEVTYSVPSTKIEDVLEDDYEDEF